MLSRLYSFTSRRAQPHVDFSNGPCVQDIDGKQHTVGNPTPDVGSGSGPSTAQSGSYLARLLAAPPSLRAAVLSHDSTKLYTGAWRVPMNRSEAGCGGSGVCGSACALWMVAVQPTSALVQRSIYRTGG